MSMEDCKEIPTLVDGNLQIQLRPTITNSDSLEDGEIVEGRFSSVQSSPRPSEGRSKGEHLEPKPLRSPTHRQGVRVGAPTPAFQPGTPAYNSANSPAPIAVELSNSRFQRSLFVAHSVRFLPAVTEEDLDRAKSLVLDLLGWGVAPEYLVECGLSPGAVYKIFADLRLRLPSNLDS